MSGAVADACPPDVLFVQEHGVASGAQRFLQKTALAGGARLHLGPCCEHTGRPTAGVGALARKQVQLQSALLSDRALGKYQRGGRVMAFWLHIGWATP
eukprot:2754614-Alexandrium_andersonii.AAC.1